MSEGHQMLQLGFNRLSDWTSKWPLKLITIKCAINDTRPHQTCRHTSFNRLCTENDVLWSMLTTWERQFRAIFPSGILSYRERMFHPWNESFTYGTFAPRSESTWERRFQLPCSLCGFSPHHY